MIPAAALSSAVASAISSAVSSSAGSSSAGSLSEPGALARLWSDAVAIWISGGWAMIPIAIVALLMFGIGTHLHLRLREKGYDRVPERRWRTWIDDPHAREGPLGELIRFVTASSSLQAMRDFFDQIRTTELAAHDRDLKVMRVCVAAAPLFGLLGTVTGMLVTFGALAGGSGGEKTMSQISSGISEALITTETGLVIALPGLFLQFLLSRACERHRAFLAHLETICTQHLIHRDRATA